MANEPTFRKSSPFSYLVPGEGGDGSRNGGLFAVCPFDTVGSPRVLLLSVAAKAADMYRIIPYVNVICVGMCVIS
jgi:hypothetical protein